LVDRLISERVRINEYCRDQGILDIDREALGFLHSQILQLPGKPLDKLFDTSRFTETQQGVLKNLLDTARNMPGQEALVDATNRLFSDSAYRQEINDLYQKQIAPLLNTGE
jgi:hypothetical protein